MSQPSLAKQRAKKILLSDAAERAAALKVEQDKRARLIRKVNVEHRDLVAVVKKQLNALKELEENHRYHVKSTPLGRLSQVNDGERAAYGKTPASDKSVYAATFDRFIKYWKKQFPTPDNYPQSVRSMANNGYMVLFALDCDQHYFSASVIALNVFAPRTQHFDWAEKFPLMKFWNVRNQRRIFAIIPPHIDEYERPVYSGCWFFCRGPKPATAIHLKAERSSIYSKDLTQTMSWGYSGNDYDYDYYCFRGNGAFDRYSCSYTCPIYDLLNH